MFNPETCVNLKFFQVTFSTRQQGSEMQTIQYLIASRSIKT